jgi:ATP-dependent DNA helicase
MPAAAASSGKAETIAELAASLLKLEGEKIEVVPNTDAGKAGVISDEALDALLDRSPEVFAGRGVGWTSKEGDAKGATSAFKVYEGPVDEGNDALARMMGEEVEC